MPGLNGTKLSSLLLGFSVGVFSVSDLFEDVAMGGEQLVVFGSSFASPGFLTEGTDVENVFGAVGEEVEMEAAVEAWLARYRAKAFVGTGEDTTRSFNTHLVHFAPRFMGGFLHRDSQKVVGDDHHAQSLAGHLRGFHVETFHAKGGLEVSKFQLDLPAFHVEV